MIAPREARAGRGQNPAYSPARFRFPSRRKLPRVADLIDGNNLMARLGGGTREALVSELADVARAKRKKLVVVFDGPPEHGRPKVQALGDVTVVYAAPRSADDEIVRRLREARDPHAVTVVTDDHTLATASQAAGGRTIGVEAYTRHARGHLLSKAKKDVEERAKEIPPVKATEWERWFSDPKNRLR